MWFGLSGTTCTSARRAVYPLMIVMDAGENSKGNVSAALTNAAPRTAF
jgi:hypothetical protein